MRWRHKRLSMTARYYIELDTNDDEGYATDLSSDVLKLSWRLGMAQPYDLLAMLSTAEIILRNPDRTYSPEVNAQLTLGRRLRICVQEAPLEAIRTHFVGRIRSVQPNTGTFGERRCAVTVCGPEYDYQQTYVLLPLHVNVSVDDVLNTLFALPPLDEIPTDFAAGDETLSFVGEGWGSGVTIARIIRELVEAERGRFFTSRTGQAMLQNRTQAQTTPSLSMTISDNAIAMSYRYGDFMVNRVRVSLRQRGFGSAGSTLWTLVTPQKVLPGTSRDLIVQFRDTNGQRVGGAFLIDPVATTDYTANTAANGSGSDRTSQVSVSVELLAGSAARLRLTNSGSDTAYLLAGSTLRGTPVYFGETITVEAEDETSQLAYGVRTLHLDLPALDSTESAEEIAAYELARRSSPRGQVLTLTLSERTHFSDALQWSLFDRVRIVETQTGHDADYLIAAEAHEVTLGGYRHSVTWTLEPVE
jgi:hypothetical protein